MLDFVVAGSGGFIGGRTSKQLSAAGFTVASEREFGNSVERARFFVNCANVAASPSASVALLEQKFATAGSRVDTFVMMQSFVTLHGTGTIDLTKFNCGKQPLLLNLYAAGKLAQEKAIYAGLSSSVAHVCLLYLPAVLGEGGDWSRAIEQARLHGYVLPPELDAQARPNHIDVDDVATFLIDCLWGSKPKALSRVILNRPQSAAIGWPEFIGASPNAAATSPALSAQARLKMRAVAWASRSGLLVPLERSAREALRKNVGPPTAGPKPAVPAQELRFDGLVRHIVATQQYIPAAGTA